MKNALAVVATAASLFVASPGRAEAPVESIYFEAHVAGHDGKVILNAHVMVKMGADAEVSFPTATGRITLKYTVRPGLDRGALVIATGLRDGQLLAAGTVAVAHDGRATLDLKGGGYDWHITGERSPRGGSLSPRGD